MGPPPERIERVECIELGCEYRSDDQPVTYKCFMYEHMRIVRLYAYIGWEPAGDDDG